MTREQELQGMKVDNLRKLASKLGIKNNHSLKKANLIEAILGAEAAKDSESQKMVAIGEAIQEGIQAGLQSANDEGKIDNQAKACVEVEDKGEKKSTGTIIDMEQKMSYIEQAKVGTLVAFRLPTSKVISAKVVKKSTAHRRFMVETAYGAQYIVGYDDIMWVRTGNRWPRGVYRLLKGLVDDNGNENEKD